MDSRVIGSILLVVGTAIGAGMLALPIVTAELGFIGSLVMLFVCWLVMTGGAFLLLEINLWMPANSNLVTMARQTLGPVGQVITWLTFLLLLYSLLCAYISGGSNLFQYLLQSVNLPISTSMSSILFTLIFGAVVFLGIHITDYVNRSLMFVKLGSYVLLVCCLMPFVSLPNLATSNLSVLKTSAAMIVTITSFGFSIIVPSLRIYLNGDIRKLKKTILIGSLIPLVCYIIWDMVIMGVVPLQGANGLGNILHSSQSTSLLVANLTATTNHHAVTLFVKLFTSICVLTSFLGVSLCLSDFLADGFGLEKVGFNRIIIHAAAFLPPLLVVLINPNAFIRALEYAGIYCIVLLVLMPAWMTLRGRRVYSSTAFRVPGGSWLLYLLIGFAALSIVYGLVC